MVLTSVPIKAKGLPITKIQGTEIAAAFAGLQDDLAVAAQAYWSRRAALMGEPVYTRLASIVWDLLYGNPHPCEPLPSSFPSVA